MSTTPCPHCGTPLEGSDSSGRKGLEQATVDLDSHGIAPIVPDISSGDGDRAEVATNHGPSPAGRRRRMAVAVVALICVLAALALFQCGSGDDSAEPVGDDEAPIASDGTSGERDSAQVPAGDPNFPPSDEHLAADDISDLFTNWVDGDERWIVAYPSPMGLQVLSAFGAEQPEIDVAVGFEEAARFPILSDGDRSWAVDPSRTDLAYLVSTQFVVTDIDREGRVAFINDSIDPPNIGESSFGAWGPGFDLPAGASVLAVGGRGLFVLPATGGTFEYVANGVEPFADDVLVAASLDSEVFERCDDQLACELYVQGPALDGAVVLDVAVGATLWPSPNGRWLVVDDKSTSSRIVDLVEGTERTLDGRVRAVDWADDESLAALLSQDELIMFRTRDGALRAVTLPIAASAPSVLLAAD